MDGHFIWNCSLFIFFTSRNARLGIEDFKPWMERCKKWKKGDSSKTVYLEIWRQWQSCTHELVAIFKSIASTPIHYHQSTEGCYALYCTEQISPLPFIVLHFWGILFCRLLQLSTCFRLKKNNYCCPSTEQYMSRYLQIGCDVEKRLTHNTRLWVHQSSESSQITLQGTSPDLSWYKCNFWFGYLKFMWHVFNFQGPVQCL